MALIGDEVRVVRLEGQLGIGPAMPGDVAGEGSADEDSLGRFIGAAGRGKRRQGQEDEQQADCILHGGRGG